MFKKLFSSLLGKGSPEEPVVEPPSFHERRKGLRRVCNFTVEGWVGRNPFEATVVDMSAGGLLFSCPADTKLKRNSTVSLTYPELIKNCEVDTVECNVIWARVKECESALYVGVNYTDPRAMGRSWVKAKMKAIGFRKHNLREQRKTCRVDCKLSGTLKLPGSDLPCTIRNIGLGGAFIQVAKPIRTGAQLTFEIHDHPTLSGTTYEAMVRHLQHPEPSTPFFHGFLFRGLSPEQEQAVKDFMVIQREEAWELTSKTNYDFTAEAEDEPAETWDEGELISDEEFEKEKAAVLEAIAAEEAMEAEAEAAETVEDETESEAETPELAEGEASLEPGDEDDAFVPKYKSAEEALAALEAEIEAEALAESESVGEESLDTPDELEDDQEVTVETVSKEESPLAHAETPAESEETRVAQTVPELAENSTSEAAPAVEATTSLENIFAETDGAVDEAASSEAAPVSVPAPEVASPFDDIVVDAVETVSGTASSEAAPVSVPAVEVASPFDDIVVDAGETVVGTASSELAPVSVPAVEVASPFDDIVVDAGETVGGTASSELAPVSVSAVEVASPFDDIVVDAGETVGGTASSELALAQPAEPNPAAPALAAETPAAVPVPVAEAPTAPAQPVVPAPAPAAELPVAPAAPVPPPTPSPALETPTEPT